MPEPLTFALVREGTSDDGLLPHLRELMVRAGAPAVFGSSRDYIGSVLDCLNEVQSEDGQVHIVFVHRDADRSSGAQRRAQILSAASSLVSPLVIPVVPIQELEAWLLVDEMAIREVVGRPRGRSPLPLPPLTAIERQARPKEVLMSACLIASETTGRRRDQERRAFPRRRRTLLERLDIDGPVRQLTSWRQMEADIAQAVSQLV